MIYIEQKKSKNRAMFVLRDSGLSSRSLAPPDRERFDEDVISIFYKTKRVPYDRTRVYSGSRSIVYSVGSSGVRRYIISLGLPDLRRTLNISLYLCDLSRQRAVEDLNYILQSTIL